MTAEVTIRPMGAGDIDRVVEIAGSLTQAPQWPREVYESAVRQGSAPRRIALIAEESGIVVGFAIVSVVLDEAELETIAVEQRWQRRGVGGRLLRSLAGELGRCGVTKVLLEVRVSNSAAQQLYRSNGFEDAGLRRGYYADPKEDARVMERAIGSVGRR